MSSRAAGDDRDVHRRALNELLTRYRAAWPREQLIVDRFEAFVREHEDCLLRSCVPGHITASCWILAPTDNAALMTHHRKLDRWLQLGGHVDGEPNVELAALREAREESGMQQFEFLPWAARGLTPLDLDVHPIPARGAEPAHDHWDVRFLLRAGPGQQLAISDESHDLRWFRPDQVRELTAEDSVLRLSRKAAALLADC